jgi:hypothetical protein
MVDDQAVLAFLQHLNLVLSEALRGDKQQRLRRLTMIHALVMALLADHRSWTRPSGRRLLASPSWIPDRSLGRCPAARSCPDGPLDLEPLRCHGLGPTRTAGRCVGDNCQSSGLYGPIRSSQVRLGDDSGESGLVGCSCGLWNDCENDHLSKRRGVPSGPARDMRRQGRKGGKYSRMTMRETRSTPGAGRSRSEVCAAGLRRCPGRVTSLVGGRGPRG